MESKSLRNVLSLFLLTAFLFFKVADLHAFSHFSDDFESHDCELCEISLDSQQFKPIIHSFDESEKKNDFFLKKNEINIGYKVPIFCIVYPSFIHNKPPPILK